MIAAANWILTLAGLLGATGVGLGAFGAHALKSTLEAHGTLETWWTAVAYQLIHAVALLALGAIRGFGYGRTDVVAGCWGAGVLCFSGSLYALALGGPKLLGPVTPLGGLLLIAGWLVLAWSAFNRPTA